MFELDKNMFLLRKRNVSMRRFFYAPKTCLIGKTMIIISFGVIAYMCTSL